tara:strand:- start:4700 stop:4897 length:198 start_codon:yes stop_codon:yes gene_type:complete
MCTTGICNAIYLLTVCIFGWLGVAFLIGVRGGKTPENRKFFAPLIKWINNELLLKIKNNKSLYIN